MAARWLPRRECLCGHMWAAHAHYRRGSECASCGCRAYRPRGRRRRRTRSGTLAPANMAKFQKAVDDFLRQQP